MLKKTQQQYISQTSPVILPDIANVASGGSFYRSKITFTLGYRTQSSLLIFTLSVIVICKKVLEI